MKEKIQQNDFLNYHFLSNLIYAKDEQHAVYVRSQCYEKKNTYQRYLYVFDGDTHRQLTTYGQESMFLWEDDQHVLFSNMRDEDDLEAVKQGEELTTFYRIDIHGGEAQKAFTIPLQVTSMKRIKEGVYAILANYHLLYSHMYALNENDKKSVIKQRKEMEDYEIFDELPFYGNGAGITNKMRNTLFIYEEKTGKITRISEETCDVSDMEINDDHSILYYVGENFTKKKSFKDVLYQYDLVNHISEALLEKGHWSIHALQPWNKNVLVMASEQLQYGVNENSKFYMYDTNLRTMTLFADYEESLGSSVGSDCRYGGGSFKKLYRDAFYFTTTIRNASHIYCLDHTGTITPIWEEEGSVDCFDIIADTIMSVAMLQGRLQEIYSYGIQTKELFQRSIWNEDFFHQKDVRPYEAIQFIQDDMMLDGWVLTPHNFDPQQSYPAILDIHGGPKTVYGEVFYHEMQYWANQGYIVFFMNPRGGDGRGNAFMDIRGKYGTIDYDDIMKFTDCVLAKYPMIDQSRIGVTGGSYGGFMTNWIIGHTDRFKAAASQRSISNWVSFANTSDIGEMFGLDQQGSDAWSDIDNIWNHSPLKYANKVKTPTLFIHSDEDYRCPLSEGIQMYSALRMHGVETRFCLFHGENHELSRSGKPKHRVKRLEEITSWMDTYLK